MIRLANITILKAGKIILRIFILLSNNWGKKINGLKVIGSFSIVFTSFDQQVSRDKILGALPIWLKKTRQLLYRFIIISFGMLRRNLE